MLDPMTPILTESNRECPASTKRAPRTLLRASLRLRDLLAAALPLYLAGCGAAAGEDGTDEIIEASYAYVAEGETAYREDKRSLEQDYDLYAAYEWTYDRTLRDYLQSDPAAALDAYLADLNLDGHPELLLHVSDEMEPVATLIYTLQDGKVTCLTQSGQASFLEMEASLYYGTMPADMPYWPEGFCDIYRNDRGEIRLLSGELWSVDRGGQYSLYATDISALFQADAADRHGRTTEDTSAASSCAMLCRADILLTADEPTVGYYPRPGRTMNREDYVEDDASATALRTFLDEEMAGYERIYVPMRHVTLGDEDIGIAVHQLGAALEARSFTLLQTAEDAADAPAEADPIDAGNPYNLRDTEALFERYVARLHDDTLDALIGRVLPLEESSAKHQPAYLATVGDTHFFGISIGGHEYLTLHQTYASRSYGKECFEISWENKEGRYPDHEVRDLDGDGEMEDLLIFYNDRDGVLREEFFMIDTGTIVWYGREESLEDLSMLREIEDPSYVTMDADAMHLIYDDGKVREVYDIIYEDGHDVYLYTPKTYNSYQDAYHDLVHSVWMNCATVYLNDDDIPEILLRTPYSVYDWNHRTQLAVYTYADGHLIQLLSLVGDGGDLNLCYIPRGNSFYPIHCADENHGYRMDEDGSALRTLLLTADSDAEGYVTVDNYTAMNLSEFY